MRTIEKLREIERKFAEDEIEDEDIIWMIRVIKDALNSQSRLIDLIGKDI